ncbi:class I SAM-dependent methyltransferase [Rhizobium rhizogenes]|jgi:cyclopropane fatty-acyl-phospholipid synthase-like methyltransferase|uniref:class I SAM-dependent methyltransferase n=1 Tax=Rhizobium rhizogenes TaxID=359 RepID=UPI0015744159|nr:class I SAM-dependent methyltransferase [Rhizobium rhizogenes]NTF85447.1 methyltransferase domain-containing protein [Rhizobium rhizogenes]
MTNNSMSLNSNYADIVSNLVPMWSELLPDGNLAVTEKTNFFLSGGHSLLAMLLMSRVKTSLGKAVPLFALVENPTLGGFARYLLEMRDTENLKEAPAPDGSVSQTERLLGYNSVERRNRRNNWFEDYYATAMNSAAHAEFCQRVYGQNFGQHGMADTTQVDLILDRLKPSQGDVILDLGCGYGLISQYISQKTGAKVVGVDLSQSAISYANSISGDDENLEFHVMDIGDLKFPQGTFTHIISIDTVYYAPSLEALLRSFRYIGAPDLQLAILRTFPIRSFTKETWRPDLTELAYLLRQIFGDYETVDFSREENDHWRKKVDVLKALKNEFLKEGNQSLFDFRYREAAYEADIEQFRYLFLTGTGK